MQYPGKAPPPYIESHRLELEAEPRRGGLVPIDAATLAALHAIRRRPPPRDPLRFGLAFAAALILHILLVVVVRYEMEPRPQVGYVVPDDREEVLEVRFIEPPPRATTPDTPPPPPVVEPPPKVRSPEATRPEPKLPKQPPKEATPAEPSPPSPVPSARAALFAADGSIKVPVGQAGSTQANFVPRKPTDDTGIMSHKTTVTYTGTRFNKDWAPDNETIVDTGVRRVIEKTTVKKTIDLGHGVRVKCATVLFVLPVGCGGEDPSAGAKKDGDVRLNMAPANPLAKDLPDQPTPPSEAECIAAFRAEKPLPQGCATDTPLKAMDQENAERVRRLGK